MSGFRVAVLMVATDGADGVGVPQHAQSEAERADGPGQTLGRQRWSELVDSQARRTSVGDSTPQSQHRTKRGIA